MSLYKRLVISLTLVFAGIIYLIIWWSGELRENTQLESEQRLHLGLAKHLVQDNPLLADGVYDYDGLKNLFHTLMMLGPSFEFYYLDPNGRILTYSAEPGKIKRSHIDIEPVKQLISGIQPLPILGDDPKSSGLLTKQLSLDTTSLSNEEPINSIDQDKKIFSAAPVYNNNVLQGYLYMIIGGEIHDSILAAVKKDNQFGDTSIIAAISIAFMLAILLVLFRFFTLPLCKISNSLKDLGNGQWNKQGVSLNLDFPKDDELQLVVSTINNLLGKIQGQFSQLENIDEQRRILLADLSHDLRTPLASLQGYIETLYMHGERLSADERKKFINISMKNSKNLKRLIDQIFELAYLEGGQVTLKNESVALGELLYDVAAKFELKAARKNIVINVEPAECNYQIFSDIGKLERVLSNLIDNAIRHTPKQGEITLSVFEVTGDKQQLRIEVKDTGIGINQQELAHIFQARYRASNTREDTQPHAGLGLAISKSLVALFKSDLSVESEEGTGTRFSFQVPRVTSL